MFNLIRLFNYLSVLSLNQTNDIKILKSLNLSNFNDTKKKEYFINNFNFNINYSQLVLISE